MSDVRDIAALGFTLTTTGVPLLVVALADAHLAWTDARHQVRAQDPWQVSVSEERALIRRDLLGALLGLVMLLAGIWIIG